MHKKKALNKILLERNIMTKFRWNDAIGNNNWFQLLACELMEFNTWGNRLSNLTLINAGFTSDTEEAELIWC